VLETHPEIEQAHGTTMLSDTMMVLMVKSAEARMMRAVCLFEGQLSKVAPIIAQSSPARWTILDSHLRAC
jgi:hypothetical protein